MKIQFTKEYTVQAADGQTYKIGDTVELSRVSAHHFTRRGVAVEVEEPAKKSGVKKQTGKGKAATGSASQPAPASTSTTSTESESTETDTTPES